MSGHCWPIRIVPALIVVPLLALPAVTATSRGAVIPAPTPDPADVRLVSALPPVRGAVDAALIGSNDVVGAKRAYIDVASERRNIPLQEVGGWIPEDPWPQAGGDAGAGGADPVGFASVGANSGVNSAASGSQGSAPVPASVTSAMLLAGLGLLAMVVRRRTLAR